MPCGRGEHSQILAQYISHTYTYSWNFRLHITENHKFKQQPLVARRSLSCLQPILLTLAWRWRVYIWYTTLPNKRTQECKRRERESGTFLAAPIEHLFVWIWSAWFAYSSKIQTKSKRSAGLFFRPSLFSLASQHLRYYSRSCTADR